MTHTGPVADDGLGVPRGMRWALLLAVPAWIALLVVLRVCGVI